MGREARANQTAADSMPFLFSVPIAKVDKETRLVTGIVTSEILDKQGDIVDYEAAKKIFTNEETWPGNMREMHQPKAVGKRITVECDDANKTISVTSRVSKGAPDTWEKILDGTLSMHSIGGSGKRVPEIVDSKVVGKRLFLEQLAEVSYVDNGACPTAKFEIVKSVDGHLVDAEPAEPVEEPIAKADAALDAALVPAAAVPVAYVGGSVRKLIGALVAGGTDRAAQKATIIADATAAGAEALAELPAAWGGTAVAKGGPESYDIDSALSAISVLERLLANEYYDARYSQPSGATPDPVKVAQIGMLKAAVDAVLQFLISEHQEQFTVDASDPNAMVIVSDDSAVAMFVKALEVVQKAGKRHSAKDQEMVQKIHDVSTSLGGVCKDMGDDDAEKVLRFVAGEKVAEILKGAGYLSPEKTTLLVSEPSEAITKITAELETAKAALSESQATVAKQAETVAALDARMKALEDLPAGGGPVRNAQAVDKALGGPSGEEAATADSVVKALQAVAEDSNDPTVKFAIATQIVKLQHTTQIALSPR